MPSVLYTVFLMMLGMAVTSDIMVSSCMLMEETCHVVGHGVIEMLAPWHPHSWRRRDTWLATRSWRCWPPTGFSSMSVGGRGELISEPELMHCMRDSVIAGTGLDVYENELHVPPEIFVVDIVVLSNHRAVGTPESIRTILDLIVGNLVDYNLTEYNIVDSTRK
jgi:hypothetical protein